MSSKRLTLLPNCRCRLVEIDPPEMVFKPQKALSGTGNLPGQRYISEGAVFTTDKQGRAREAIDETVRAKGIAAIRKGRQEWGNRAMRAVI